MMCGDPDVVLPGCPFQLDGLGSAQATARVPFPDAQEGALVLVLTGAGAAVIGAIAGSAIPLGLAFGNLWQVPVLAGALLWLLVVRRGVVSTLLLTGVIGLVLALLGVGV